MLSTVTCASKGFPCASLPQSVTLQRSLLVRAPGWRHSLEQDSGSIAGCCLRNHEPSRAITWVGGNLHARRVRFEEQASESRCEGKQEPLTSLVRPGEGRERLGIIVRRQAGPYTFLKQQPPHLFSTNNTYDLHLPGCQLRTRTNESIQAVLITANTQPLSPTSNQITPPNRNNGRRCIMRMSLFVLHRHLPQHLTNTHTRSSPSSARSATASWPLLTPSPLVLRRSSTPSSPSSASSSAA
jgi:hypothetical protein